MTATNPAGGKQTSTALALEFLKTRTNYEQIDRRGATLDLRPMQTLLERLGHPERGLAVVHVAGSKGKGTTTWFIDAFLRRAGIRCGRYISPHLQRLEERVAVDGRPVSGEVFARAILEVAPHVDAACATFFDILTAAALLCFRDAGVKFVAFETGIGGRLDSTNAVAEKVSTVLTSLALEHTEILGNTLEQIAREKAAIARPGIPLFSVTNPAEPHGRVVEDVARSVGAETHVLGRDFHVETIGDALNPRISVRTPHCLYNNVHLPGAATWQSVNLGLAVAVVDDLAARGFVPPMDRAVTQLDVADLAMPGRFEVIPGSPVVVLDGAHTLESIGALMDSLDRCVPARPRVVVFGASKDKDPVRLLAGLAGRVDHLIATRADSPRAANAESLRAASDSLGIPATAEATPVAALERARLSAGSRGVIAVTGSLYLVGDARTALGLS